MTSTTAAGDAVFHAASIESIVEEAYDAYAGRIKAFARAAVRDEDAADDLVQETFLRFVHEVRRGVVPDNVAGWLYRVCANLVTSRGRRRSVAERMKALLIDRSTSSSPEEDVLRGVERARLHDVLAELPADARVALLMAAEGFTAVEIGVAIGRTAGATSTYICRARIRLRERLSTLEEGSR
ncbi:MAG TPA: sigma-70 family RNA polymerase sigma factor [Candidatus Limnocylindrales bacterium]